VPRKLDPDEAALWARVMESVRPLRPMAGGVVQSRSTKPVLAEPVEALPSSSKRLLKKDSPSTNSGRTDVGANTLDGGWDKKIVRGAVAPDSVIDLHGHSQRSAHALLDGGIERALARGDRMLLLVTGKPPRAESERPHARGAIRAAIGDWLAASRHAGAIAAIRGAHPRHGGAGALYLILRRKREAGA